MDKGTVPLPNFPGEKFTQGLDGLRERLSEYRELGARFTKWRAVIAIGEGLPTPACLEANAHALALFAALSQEAGLVPIVEPEVLMDGNHTLARCEEVTRATLECVFDALFDQRVLLEGMLLKTGMVLSGKDCPQQADVEEVAEATIRCLRRAVPAAVPGIVFLSGGQSDVAATERLNAICARRCSVGGELFLRTRAAGRCLKNVARICRQRDGRTSGAPSSREVQRPRRAGKILGAEGKCSRNGPMPDFNSTEKTKPNPIGISADHGGFELKQYLTEKLRAAGHEVVDFGDRNLSLTTIIRILWWRWPARLRTEGWSVAWLFVGVAWAPPWPRTKWPACARA